MIEAARDLYVPPADAQYLWNALGHPPIQWVTSNHFAFLFAGNSIASVSAAYLNRVWSGHGDETGHLPRYVVPVFKLGFVFETDGNLSPSLTLEALSFATRRDHLSALHLDIGESGRGPFVGLATSLNPYIDLGMEHRFSSRAVQPYVALHVVF